MAKKTVKKTKAKTTKKTIVKKATVKSPVKKTKPAAKKVSKAKVAPKKTKKVITEKEREVRSANAIANSEKKKTKRVSATKIKGISKSKKGERPVKTATEEQASALLNAIVEGMQEKKAKNIAILNLSNIESRVTDFFVICDADSRTHVDSIANSVEETVYKLTSEKAYHAEGHGNGEWILVDYINVVAHIFLREIREHYNIEGLWGDAEITLIND